MDFWLNLVIVTAISGAFGWLWNYIGESWYKKSVFMRYWGGIIVGILGGMVGFYYLTSIVNYLVIGTNINFIAILLGASIALWIATRINPENRI
ncbi:MAG: hypothetical protein ACK4F9_06570 [Brevinematia bacterium]